MADAFRQQGKTILNIDADQLYEMLYRKITVTVLSAELDALLVSMER